MDELSLMWQSVRRRGFGAANSRGEDWFDGGGRTAAEPIASDVPVAPLQVPIGADPEPT